jgi:hypothetical protein
MIKKGILQGWKIVVSSLFLDDYKTNGSNHYDKLETTETCSYSLTVFFMLSNHYDKLETTEISQWTMDNG